jgi:hypothetical protein
MINRRIAANQAPYGRRWAAILLTIIDVRTSEGAGSG